MDTKNNNLYKTKPSTLEITNFETPISLLYPINKKYSHQNPHHAHPIHTTCTV